MGYLSHSTWPLLSTWSDPEWPRVAQSAESDFLMQLFQLVAEEGVSMPDHIMTFRKLQNSCTKMNVLVPNADLALLLIMSLPNSWDPFTASFFGSNYTTATMMITLSALITALCKEDEQSRTKANVMESAQRAIGKGSCLKPRWQSVVKYY